MDAGLASFKNYLEPPQKNFSQGALQANAFFDQSQGDHHTSGESSPWDFSDKLTISFAPDGTQVGSQQSSLYDSFKGFLNAAQVESTILKAFQTWAIRSNINFGLQEDSGDAFGVQGETQGDERFGDIRIAAIPLSADIFAISIPHEELLSGTWSGDLLINSNANFANVQQFYSVILHEAGHILGLTHNNDPTSVMHPVNRIMAPTRNDANDLRSIYGVRRLDINELPGKTNDIIDDATEIDNPGKYDGEIPLVVYGDLGNASDKDFFTIENLDTYDGQLTFRLFNKSLSLVLPKVTIFDENGLTIESAFQLNHRRPEVKISFNADANMERYFVLVEGQASQKRFGVGTYALATTFDDVNTRTDADLRAAISSDYSMLEQSDLHKILAGEDFFEDDDNNTDDDHDNARALTSDDKLRQKTVYRYSGSLSNAADIDFFKIETPDAVEGRTMIIKVKSIDESGFIPKIRVYDDQDQNVSWRYLVNGEGELVVQVDQVSEKTEYKVSVESTFPGDFPTGNYDMEIGFSNKVEKLNSFSAGTLAVGRTRFNQALYIARNQLFNIGLRVKSLGSLNNAGVTVWTTLYDEQGNVLHRVASRPGELRTTNSILLDPGKYHLVTTLSYSAAAKSELIQKGNVEFSVLGRQVDEPTGPDLVDPSQLPFQKCNQDTKYCYPGNVSTPDPYVFVDGQPRETPPIVVEPPKYVELSLWYWNDDKLN